jgi:pimeloyl-ACP methyl ester carboxylesterase
MKYFYKRKRFYFALLVSASLVLTYDFLKLRKTDQEFKDIFETIGMADHSNIDYHLIGTRRMRYVEVGYDSLPLVVFIHGAPSSSAFWTEFLQDTDLLSNAKLLAVDRPGYGYSGFGKIETSVEKQAEMVAEILKVKKINNQPLVLLGSSYGGTVAARLAMDYPDLIDGVVFQSSSLAPGEETTYWISYPTSHWMVSWLLPITLQVANAEKLSHKKELEKMVPLWEKVKAYCTILHGAADDLVFPSNAFFAKDKLINARKVELVLVPERGHDLSWTKPELIKETLLKTIDALTHNKRVSVLNPANGEIK